MLTIPFPHDQLQTFFISQEFSTGPIINNILEETKKIAELTYGDNTQGMISIGFGKRTSVTAESTPFKTIQPEHLIEIVDYDTTKQILLVMGKKEPIKDVAVHWIIHHAKNEIGIIIYLKDTEENEQLISSIPHINAIPHGSILDRSKTILKALQKQNTLYLEGEGIFLTGRTISEVQQQLLHFRGHRHEDRR